MPDRTSAEESHCTFVNALCPNVPYTTLIALLEALPDGTV